MRSLLLTFDIEPFVLGEDFDKSLEKEQSNKIALEGLDALASLLKGIDAKATLFVSYDFSKLCKNQLKELAGQGNEIALHCYSHSDNYAEMPREKAVERIKAAKKGLEKAFSTTVNGFRAPRMQAFDRSILSEAGFSYDSSLHPTYLPGYYNNFFSPRNVFSDKGIKVVPVSVSPVLRLPFSWFFFRNFGLGYAKACSNLSLFGTNFLNLYFHNWEFADLKKKIFPKIPGYFLRNSGKSLASMLRDYVEWSKKNGIEAKTISEFLHLV